MARSVVEFLLDFAISIDRFNGSPGAKRYLSSIRGTAAISVVTRAEVLTGFEKASRRTAIRFLDFFPTLEITKPVTKDLPTARHDDADLDAGGRGPEHTGRSRATPEGWAVRWT